MTFDKHWKPLSIAAIVVVICGVGFWRLNHSNAFNTVAPPLDGDSALVALRKGNGRFVKSARIFSCDTHDDDAIRHQTAAAQHPFVAVVCCSDSRVCPEFIFDLRPGSVFEIRNAGNVVDDDVLASLEYAVEHLHVPLILVMGHKGCGAIEAVFEAKGTTLPGHLRQLQEHMGSVVDQNIDRIGQSRAELLNQLSKENAREQASILLRESDILKAAVDSHQVRICCGLYDMETGLVDFIGP